MEVGLLAADCRDDSAQVSPQRCGCQGRRPKRLRGGSKLDIAGFFVSLLLLCVMCSIAVYRNYGCNFSALKDVEPAFDGSLLPPKFMMSERKSWFQFAKYIDVYALPSLEYVGYFYDMNFLLFMRFGFSDAKDRIWFEATYPSFWSRFKFFNEFTLQRCDVGAGARDGGVFDIKEDTEARTWFCLTNCARRFDISRSDADQYWNSATGTRVPVASVVFNSTFEFHAFGGGRQAWYLDATDPESHEQIASAQQRFYWGGTAGWNLLSNWTVDVRKQSLALPNFVVGFMAALDDLEEEH